MTNPTATELPNNDFIREQIQRDVAAGVNGGVVLTRFPPEPNGYLHVGHAKSICLNFGAAADFGGTCNLRMDDTNPAAEESDYVDGILEDVKWLGFAWNGEVQYASDKFEQLFEWAKILINTGDAYVDDQNAETIAATRGSITEPGTNSPFRDRSPEENLSLFDRMRAGDFKDGEKVLRAKINMADPNGQLRDPIMYRIRHIEHHRTGNAWCIYPTYDWAHGQSDALEGITHSVCTLEFDAHRALYDWYLDRLPLPTTRPRQYEFARLALTYTLMSKRKLLQLVREQTVTGWDDPRMPTLRGMRKRGYPAAALRAFCAHIGVGKMNSTHEIELLEYFVRNELNKIAVRRMAVLRPIKVVIENYPEGQVEWLDAVNNPEDPEAGSRKIPFSRTLYMEAEDFMEVPAPKFFRLYPGNEVRLRYAYFLTCTGVIKDADGNVTELRATYDPLTAGGQAPDGRKVKTTLHWVSAEHAAQVEVREYAHLFTDPNPGNHEGKDPLEFLNPDSINVLQAQVEPALAAAVNGEVVQFERLGYFCAETSAGTASETAPQASPQASLETPAEMSPETPAEMRAQTPAEVSDEMSAKAAEMSAKTPAELSDEMSAKAAEMSAQTPAEVSDETSPETSAEPSAKTPAKMSAEMRAEMSPEVSAKTSAEMSGVGPVFHRTVTLKDEWARIQKRT